MCNNNTYIVAPVVDNLSLLNLTLCELYLVLHRDQLEMDSLFVHSSSVWISQLSKFSISHVNRIYEVNQPHPWVPTKSSQCYVPAN